MKKTTSFARFPRVGANREPVFRGGNSVFQKRGADKGSPPPDFYAIAKSSFLLFSSPLGGESQSEGLIRKWGYPVDSRTHYIMCFNL
jgi:hypothetical protein